MAILYIMLLCDSVIAGFFIGENGVAAINAITPVTNIITFFANIVTVGTGILYSRAIGAMDKKRADALFGQGLILNAAIALCCAAALLLGKDLYFAANGVTGEIYALASDYYRWTPLCALFAVFNAYIGQMVYTDGDETCTNISYVFQIVGNVALSIALVRSWACRESYWARCWATRWGSRCRWRTSCAGATRCASHGTFRSAICGRP